MTREKKELLKQIRQIDEAESMSIRLDEAMGPLTPACYEHIADFYGEQRRPLLIRLNELMHGRVNDYFCACVL